jgi:hypothetical protein
MINKKFNLQEYKLAQVIEGPDMSKFNISKLEMMKEKLEKQYPNIAWTLEEVKKWINKYIFEKQPSYKSPDIKDTEWKG